MKYVWVCSDDITASIIKVVDSENKAEAWIAEDSKNHWTTQYKVE